MPKIKIDTEKCKGCLLCVSVCPKNMIAADGELNNRGLKPVVFKDTGDCIGCTMCAVICPECCIEVWK